MLPSDKETDEIKLARPAGSDIFTEISISQEEEVDGITGEISDKGRTEFGLRGEFKDESGIRRSRESGVYTDSIHPTTRGRAVEHVERDSDRRCGRRLPSRNRRFSSSQSPLTVPSKAAVTFQVSGSAMHS